MTTVKTLRPGNATGPLLILDEPLSLWGGVDVHTGEIVEQSHPQVGENMAEKIVVLPHGRGSSSSSSVLAELLRVGLGPVGLVLDQPDSILVVGAIVAERLYGARCPIVVGRIDGHSGEIWPIADGSVQLVKAGRERDGICR